MVIYKAFVNGCTVYIDRIDLKAKCDVVRELNSAKESANSLFDQLPPEGLVGDVYASTKKEMNSKLREIYKEAGARMRSVTIYWQWEENA